MRCPYCTPANQMLVSPDDVRRGWVKCWCGAGVELCPALTSIHWDGALSMPDENSRAWVTLPAHEYGTGRLDRADALLVRRWRRATAP